MHPIVELARKSIETYIREGKILTPPDSPAPELSGKAGVFVCLKRRGELRGCIGTFMPVCESIARETIANAIAAATKDPRFPPVREEELSELSCSVDVLTCPEKVSRMQRNMVLLFRADIDGGFFFPILKGWTPWMTRYGLQR